jgi:ABC-2 type transport system ATP-binding protein
MIEVERLSRSFGALRAVDRLTFAVARGEVVGLLGPNGAGKTTTMRLLTTYLEPTGGRATLAGFDVARNPRDVRAHVGYLPEGVPLYDELRVRAFLDFRARLKDVPRGRRRAAVDGVIASCGLEGAAHRPIGQLSRGYRQRVGLADALVHDPDIVILDEPTGGLDPIQIREIRALIRALGERHTVLLSTHILPEVEAVCDRVILIAGGRIALDDRIDRLRAETAMTVEAAGPADAIARALEAMPGVASVRTRGESGGAAVFEVRAEGGADLREALARRVVQNGWGLRRLDWQRSTLEDRYVEAVRAAGRREPQSGAA